MLHGWGGIQDALTVSYYEEFTRAGYAVMTFDYRGWGDSAGLPRHVISARQRVADGDAALVEEGITMMTAYLERYATDAGLAGVPA